MGEKLIDDLARALAQPMPRRKAVRVLGVTLVAAAVPGVRSSPALARRTATCDSGCGPDRERCPTIVNLGSGPDVCCPEPAHRYTCGGNPFFPDTVKCVDKCGGPSDIPCKGPKDQTGCSKFVCCKRPESVGCVNATGECIPNCAYPAGSCKKICGKTCCEQNERCLSGKCFGCGPNAQHCTSGNCDETICCRNGTRCCFNQTSTVCCGVDQDCQAKGKAQATCKCKPGKGRTCGPDCCKEDEFCLNTLDLGPKPRTRIVSRERCTKRCLGGGCGKNCCGVGLKCNKGKCVPRT